jgi:hypothetical protein
VQDPAPAAREHHEDDEQPPAKRSWDRAVDLRFASGSRSAKKSATIRRGQSERPVVRPRSEPNQAPPAARGSATYRGRLLTFYRPGDCELKDAGFIATCIPHVRR